MYIGLALTDFFTACDSFGTECFENYLRLFRFETTALVDALGLLFQRVSFPREEQRSKILLRVIAKRFSQGNAEIREIDNEYIERLARCVVAISEAAVLSDGPTFAYSKSDFLRHMQHPMIPGDRLGAIYNAARQKRVVDEGRLTQGQSKSDVMHDYFPYAHPVIRRTRSWPSHIPNAPTARPDASTTQNIAVAGMSYHVLYSVEEQTCLAYVGDDYVIKLMSASLEVNKIVHSMELARTVLGHIVPVVHDYGHLLGCTYILMQRVQGWNLARLVRDTPNSDYSKVDLQINSIVEALAKVDISHNDFPGQGRPGWGQELELCELASVLAV